jgi:hypothetical protein
MNFEIFFEKGGYFHENLNFVEFYKN